MDSLGITTIITVLATWHVFNSFLTLSKDHGIFRALILLFLFPDAREVMDRIEKHLLRSDPKNAMIMKKALADDCTMLAVAVRTQSYSRITFGRRRTHTIVPGCYRCPDRNHSIVSW